ncbi:MKI67 FHA domain-interacting nucleolar phosphoprotein [Camellia lanceoleosa]|uniref:MKI67 FHA domain-interacting nucleolar phosphoprotein n=1 Tax=Camellia lanceoleosa TaxID=1840588 RepID=A0ACC0J4F9_9ERIC|nr:MKI67 FHA domain-interacting nucleolar phosphoprotein [Camellia lanceoleosa]
MGAKAKKAMMKKLKKGSSQKDESVDFLPLEGGPGHKLPKSGTTENKATVLYIGRLPHGFYENEMEGFFKQFGTIKKLRLAKNKKTGKSKHFGFIEFESPEVAKIVFECMHTYLMFEHMFQVHLIPPERVHPKLWKGPSRWHKPVDWVQIERKRHDKERTLEEHKKLVGEILIRDQKKRKKIEVFGIDYECPEIVFLTMKNRKLLLPSIAALPLLMAYAGHPTMVIPKPLIPYLGLEVLDLVAVDSEGSPVSVSWSDDSRRNVIVWMDHRAIKQAERINSSNSTVLQYCGGALSPEMLPPKVLMQLMFWFVMLYYLMDFISLSTIYIRRIQSRS